MLDSTNNYFFCVTNCADNIYSNYFFKHKVVEYLNQGALYSSAGEPKPDT